MAKCFYFQASLEQEGAGAELLEKSVEALGGLDLLVNNAGVTRFENILDLTAEVFDLLFHLDFKNYILMMQAAARYMVKNKIRGSLINITSSRGERAYAGDFLYGGLKAGLNRAIQSIALDLAPYGIRVNNVAPGGHPGPGQTGTGGSGEDGFFGTIWERRSPWSAAAFLRI